MNRIQLLCLASSLKLGGRCIAGINLRDGSWVRPVSESEDGTLFLTQSLPQWPAVGEIWDVPLADHCPEPWQPENWLVDTSENWQLVETLDSDGLYERLDPAIDNSAPLFGTYGASVSEFACQQEPRESSVQLVEPDSILWHVGTGRYGRRQYRGQFGLGEDQYDLAVTDISWKSKMSRLDLELGDHESDALGIAPDSRVLFTVSLGEPYNGACYKLLAAVIVS